MVLICELQPIERKNNNCTYVLIHFVLSGMTFVIVMGVSGCGKTTVGEQLARKLGFKFCDADDFHSDENKEKMARGIPLTDEDRLPWLQTLSQLPLRHEKLVLACSALKQKYRSVLVQNARSQSFVFLDVPESELRRRLSSRQGHYMKANMLESQLATLERPQRDDRGYVIVDCGFEKSVNDVVNEIAEALTNEK
uniref:Gluconokinase n=1 Tax=Steinernema glaseri TaxID=37863 RepID=A0A1I7ZPW4_9BILA